MAALRVEWLDLFERTLAAIRTERRVRDDLAAGGAPPTIEQYIANCDNAEVRIAYSTYWIAVGDHTLLDHIEALLPALWQAQVVVRWANDLRSTRRGIQEGTVLNATVLGIEPAGIERRAWAAADRCGRILRPPIAKSVEEAVVLDRMTRSVVSCHGVSD